MEVANEKQLDSLFLSFYLLILCIDVNWNSTLCRIYNSWIPQFITEQRVRFGRFWSFLLIIWELSEMATKRGLNM